jgi:hypothetical protein
MKIITIRSQTEYEGKTWIRIQEGDTADNHSVQWQHKDSGETYTGAIYDNGSSYWCFVKPCSEMIKCKIPLQEIYYQSKIESAKR